MLGHKGGAWAPPFFVGAAGNLSANKQKGARHLMDDGRLLSSEDDGLRVFSLVRDAATVIEENRDIRLQRENA